MRFGEIVRVEYVDLAQAEAQEQYGDLLVFVAERDLAYPLIAINGQLRAAGSAHYYRILPLVEDALAQAPEAAQAAAAMSS